MYFTVSKIVIMSNATNFVVQTVVIVLIFSRHVSILEIINEKEKNLFFENLKLLKIK